MSEKTSFETGIEELEKIVSRLESGEATLDESFMEYEKGVKLYRELKKILSEGEAKIIQLTQSDADDKGENDADA